MSKRLEKQLAHDVILFKKNMNKSFFDTSTDDQTTGDSQERQSKANSAMQTQLDTKVDIQLFNQMMQSMTSKKAFEIECRKMEILRKQLSQTVMIILMHFKDQISGVESAESANCRKNR